MTNVSTYKCARCGAQFGIAGTVTDIEDVYSDGLYDAEVEYHESGQCQPAPHPHADYIAGLRALADAIETDRTLSHPWTGSTHTAFSIYAKGRPEMAAWVGMLEDAAEEGTRPGSDYYTVTGRVRGLYVKVAAPNKDLGREVTREQTVFEVEPFLPVSS